MTTSRRILLALLPAALVASGCAAFRAQHSAAMWSRPKSAAVAVEAPPGVTFARVQAEILTPSCAIPDCHVSGAPGGDFQPPEGLTLEAGKSHALLVNVRAGEVDRLRVAPGDPDGSYLLAKVTPGAKIAWHPMPLNRPALSEAERQLIRDWIAAGAKND